MTIENKAPSLFNAETMHIQKDEKPSQKKIFYPISAKLRAYLKQYGREVKLPIQYSDLLHFSSCVPLRDRNGKDTHWQTLSYDMHEWEFIKNGLIRLYGILKTEEESLYIPHFNIARIDYCAFANSSPFRIRVINKYNDNYDHYYIKRGDASRVYGLELEHLLSANRMTYLTHHDTLVEDHTAGIPGDTFIDSYLHLPETNQIRIAKEFVKFNERCFVRLLGDMRAYNFVVDITPDIEDFQYRLRPIDFDQQSYEGRKNMYLPQFFKDNYPFVKTVFENLNTKVVEQYQMEERNMMAFRLVSSRYRIMQLLDIIKWEEISTPEKIYQLKYELGDYFKNDAYLKCASMGQILKRHFKQMLARNVKHLPKVYTKHAD